MKRDTLELSAGDHFWAKFVLHEETCGSCHFDSSEIASFIEAARVR
jgi:hypothetical protein